MNSNAILQGGVAVAQDAGGESTPDLQGMLMHHLLDSNEIEFEILGRGFVWHLDTYHIAPVHLGPLTIDFSPTKHIVFMFLAAILCVVVFVPDW